MELMVKRSLTKLKTRWDSSDPERAPPPLPLNPKYGESPTRGNASATIEAAAKALQERARANTGPSPYSFAPTADRSPEKSPTRTPQNKRIHNLQNGGQRDSRMMLDNKPAEWSHSRPTTPAQDVFISSPERSPTRADLMRTDSGRTERDLFGSTPSLARGARPSIRPLLSAGSPRSPTMLALQSMPYRDVDGAPLRDPAPAGDVSMSAPAPTISYPTPSNLEAIHAQMLNLTNIATTLQKEMSALSRRSKDNATDLIGLKQATNSRDEDIRKSLKDLVASVKTSDTNLLGMAPAFTSTSRPASVFASHSPQYLDNRSYHSPPMTKSTSLPRLDYGLDVERAASPYSVEGAASVAMLEKILRDMVTKEGQDHLLSTLSDMLAKANQESSGTAKKVQELLEFVERGSSHHGALVRTGSTNDGDSNREHEFEGTGERHQDAFDNVFTKELQEVLQRLKDSVAQNGGMTGEVKNIVRELRGEVLGMGREIGRKLEEIPMGSGAEGRDAQIDQEQIRAVIQEGLSELKEQMAEVVQAKRRQSTGSVTSRMAVDNSSVYAVVKHALAEHTAEGQVNQDAILTAVKEAYEAYKPEIELQQFGLERDEILQCLKEGLDDYQSSRAAPPSSINRDEVLDAVQEALQHFQPPTATTADAELKEELFAVIKDCLEEHTSATRELTSISNSQLTVQQISETVTAAIEQAQAAASTEQVLHSLHDILSGLREEMGHYSANAGEQNEQVLQAVNSGLETLRLDVASVVERASETNSASDIHQILGEGIEQLKNVLANHATSNVSSNLTASSETLDLIKDEFDKMHEVLAMRSRSIEGEHNEALSATLVGSIAELKSTLEARHIDESMEEITEAIKADFDRLREDILQGTAAQKSEVLETMQGLVSNVQSRSSGDIDDISTNQAITTLIKDEFDSLKESMAMSMMPVTNLDNKQDITSTLRNALQDMTEQLFTNQNDASAETLSVLKDEIQNLRGAIGNSSTSAPSAGANIELLEAIRDGLDGLRNYSSRSEVDAGIADALDSVRDELESMREVVKTAFISTGSALASQDNLESIKQGLDDLTSRVAENSVNSDRDLNDMSGTRESFNDVLTELKAEVAKVAEKPIDMAVSYETLDLLKSGHSAILFEIERLRNDVETAQKDRDNQVVLSEANSRETAESARPVSSEDLEQLEVMLAQLQIKIEAMNQNIEGSASTATSTTTLQAIANLEAMLEVLQATVAANAHRGQSASGGATKEDTDAIEVLLLNTKARLEEEILPAIKASVTKEDLDNIEALVRMTGDSVENVSSKLAGPMLTKDDLVALEGLLQDVSSSMKAAKLTGGIAAGDLAGLQDICNTMKDKMDSLLAEGQVSARADIENVTALIATMQQGIDKLQQLHETNIEVTAKAFNDRKGESQNIVDQIAELKTVLEETQEEIRSRIKKSNKDVRALDEILQEIEDKIDQAPNAVSSVEEFSEYVKAEFARTNTALGSLSTTLDSSSKEILDKHTDIRAAIVVELSMKLDEQKAETARVANSISEVAEHLNSRVGQQEAILSESKALSDELKLTIDTLGASVTAISPALVEATDKMTDDSRTVFNKIDAMHARLEADHTEDKDEHELTRAHLAKSLSAISLLREQLSEDHPEIMATLKSLLTLVSEHYEHSKDHKQANSADFNRMLTLPGLERSSNTTETAGNLGDQYLHSKLDDLLKHATTSEKNVGSLEKLNEIHQQVMNTAGEVSAFVAFQTKMTTAVHDNKEEEAKQAAVHLSRSIAETQQLESKITNLQRAKDELAADVEALMADRDALTSQKMRLTAEVASLHTAMEIRREEIEMMDARADALHRRIVEGVMNQSRALLMSKPGKRAVNMNLKRAGSNTSRATDATTTPSTLVSTGVGMTLQHKSPQRKEGVALSSGGRRIVSLGQGRDNALPVGQRPLNLSRNVTTGPLSLKRVQSIKSQRLREAPTQDVEYDKENDGVDSHDFQRMVNPTHAPSTNRSDSYAGSYDGRSVSYGTQPSEYSYGTGSYLSGSDLNDRRTSYGFSEASVNRRDRQSVGSTIRTDPAGQPEYAESIYEDDEEEEHQQGEEHAQISREGSPTTVLDDHQNQHEEVEGQKKEGRRVGDSDSGLGSDLPTAALSAENFNGYFPDNQQETIQE